MSKLEQYYSGDNDWNEFVALYDEFWTNNQFQQELADVLGGKIDLAKVIYGKFSTSSLVAINQKVPALDNLTILECIESEQLILRLRVCLMRMP